MRQTFPCILIALAACQSVEELPARAGRFSVGDHALALTCSSGPPPRVVIDAGLGESSASWRDVVRGLQGLSVCTFDRAGYGASDPGAGPRTPERNAAELAALVDAAGLEEPLVLVGHSLGALNALAFWRGYPEHVAGMLLLDPPPRAWLERRRFAGLWDMAMQAGAQLQAQADAADPGSREARMMAAAASETAGMLADGASVSAIDSFGDLPLEVVASGRANPAFGDSAAAYQAFWAGESEALAARSSRGTFVRLDQAGHNMNGEVPGAVAALVRTFVSVVRRPSRRPHDLGS